MTMSLSPEAALIEDKKRATAVAGLFLVHPNVILLWVARIEQTEQA